MTSPAIALPSGAPEPAVSVRRLVKRYGRTLALDEVNLEVPGGCLFALLGPNGAGKTTLMHILATILSPDSGTALVAGHDVVRRPLRARRNIGVVFQEPSLDDRLTVHENLDFHGMVYGVGRRARKRRINEVLALVELTEWEQHLARALSSGMKRRLEIARALLHEPRILFLDEPTVGLDVQSRERIWRYLEELRKVQDLTVIVTTHYIGEVEHCDQVCIIDHGQLLTQGSPDELKARHGHETLRVVPRDPATAGAIQARYPQAVEAAGGALVFQVPGPGFMDPFLSEFGSGISQVAFETPNLESVFLSLTGRELRDKAAGAREQTLALGRRGGEPTR